MVLQTERASKKNFFPLEIYRRIYPVGDSVTYRRIKTVGRIVGECFEYRLKISVCKYVGHSGKHCKTPMD
jgi:hypothetical protein